MQADPREEGRASHEQKAPTMGAMVSGIARRNPLNNRTPE
jgi:hypothetical protein